MFSVGDTVIALERIKYYGVPTDVVGRQGVVVQVNLYNQFLVRFNESVNWWTKEDGIKLLYDANEVV